MEQPAAVKKKASRITFWGSIRNRLILSFVLVGIIMLALVGITVSQIGSILAKDNYVIEKTQPTQIYAYYINAQINQANLLLSLYLNDKKHTQNIKDKRFKIWEDNIKPYSDSLVYFSKSWESLESRMIFSNIQTNLDQLKRLQEVTEDLNDNTIGYDEKTGEILLADGSKNNLEELDPRKVFNKQVLPLTQEIERDIERLVKLQTQTRFQKINIEVNNSLTVFVWIEIMIVVLALLIALLLSIFLVRSLKKSVALIKNYLTQFSEGNVPWVFISNENEITALTQDLTTFAKNMEKIKIFAIEVGKGNFESDISVFGNQGDIGKSLAEMRSGLAQVAIEDKQRNWTNEGIALFSNILRNANARNTYDEFISNLVRYVNANQGSIFIVQGTGQKAHLELKSIYAYDRKRFLNKIVHLGQGLVGQTWQDKDLVYLEEVPEDFVQITSGFGEAPPRSILIVPIMLNEEYLGAIELASFRKFARYEIEFVQRTAEILVSLVSSLKKAEETEVLLQESQEKAEMMKAQEEELRQTVEQLELTQKTIVKNQIELNGQKQAIDNILMTVEFDMEGRIIGANDIFLRAMKYESIEQIEGLPHEVFIPPKDRTSESYTQLWQNLKQGIGFNGEIKRITREGTEVWLNATYTVVKDEFLQPIKIIKIANEITTQKRQSLDLERQLEAIHRSNAFMEFDLNGYIRDANPIFLEMTGYALEEIIGEHYKIFLPEEPDLREQEELMWRRLQRSESITGRFKRINKNGEYIWLYGTYNVIIDLNERPYKVVQFAYDITQTVILESEKQHLSSENKTLNQKINTLQQDFYQQKERILQLQKNVEEWQTDSRNYLNAIHYAFLKIEFTPKGIIRDVNTLATHTLGYQEDNDLIGLSQEMIFDWGEEDILGKKVWNTLLKGVPKQGIFEVFKQDDQQIYLKGAFIPLQDTHKQYYKILFLGTPQEK